jgi:hypothetical protein
VKELTLVIGATEVQFDRVIAYLSSTTRLFIPDASLYEAAINHLSPKPLPTGWGMEVMLEEQKQEGNSTDPLDDVFKYEAIIVRKDPTTQAEITYVTAKHFASLKTVRYLGSRGPGWEMRAAWAYASAVPEETPIFLYYT